METKFRVGQEVRIHPASDLFMKGVTCARITKIGREYVHLYHHWSRTTHRVTPAFMENYILKEDQ